MNCFNHQDVTAIGTCKVCGKGLCSDCLTDLGHGIACKNKHEEEAEDYKFIVDKSTKIYRKAPKNNLIVPLFYLFMGVVFAWFGYSQRGVTDFAFILGVGFIVFSLVIFVANKAIFNKKT